MPFSPIGPAELVAELAAWIDRRSSGRQRVGVDGFAECGATELADDIAEQLEQAGRPVLRISTAWWWRASALRLEHGREDVDSLLAGWVDIGTLNREVLTPLAPDGTGAYLTRLRDPVTDRAIRQTRQPSPASTVVLVDGPFLSAHPLPWEARIHLRTSIATAARALPAARAWWIAGYRRYLDEFDPEEQADVVVSFDHPAAPAVCWPVADGKRAGR